MVILLDVFDARSDVRSRAVGESGNHSSRHWGQTKAGIWWYYVEARHLVDMHEDLHPPMNGVLFHIVVLLPGRFTSNNRNRTDRTLADAEIVVRGGF